MLHDSHHCPSKHPADLTPLYEPNLRTRDTACSEGQLHIVVVRAPGLEPKSGGEEPFSLLRELSQQCLEDIRKGRTATTRQLLSMLAGVGE